MSKILEETRLANLIINLVPQLDQKEAEHLLMLLHNESYKSGMVEGFKSAEEQNRKTMVDMLMATHKK